MKLVLGPEVIELVVRMYQGSSFVTRITKNTAWSEPPVLRVNGDPFTAVLSNDNKTATITIVVGAVNQYQDGQYAELKVGTRILAQGTVLKR